MRFGCCLNMIASQPDGIGIEYIEKLAKFGFDYAELPLAEMMRLSDADFSILGKRVANSGIQCETCNNFFPSNIRLTGEQVEINRVMDYVEKALARAACLGVEIVVFGSGGAKNVPDGFPLERGYQQLVQLLKKIAPVAKKNHITIVIEPLRKQECNLINSFQEACRLARDVDYECVKMLADFYHISQEHEPVQHIREEGREYLRHVHFARNEGRLFPADIKEDNYQPFIDSLKAINYNGRISCEAYTKNFELAAPRTLKFFRTYF